MASAGSRIPTCRAVGSKRPNENAVPSTVKKRQKVLTPPPTKPTRGLKKSVSSSCLNVGRFSETYKRAVLQPPKTTSNIRQTIADNVKAKAAMSAPASAVLPKAKKLPAWDLKGRLEQMEKFNGNLNNRVAALEEEKSELNKDNVVKSIETQQASSRITELETFLRDKSVGLQEALETIKTLTAKVESLEASERSKADSLRSLEQKYEAKCQAVEQLTETISQMEVNHSVESSLNKSKLACIQSQYDATKLAMEEGLIQIERLNTVVKEQEEQLQKEETLRRYHHNMIQELKGNIRVYCRIRPPIQEEIQRKIPMSVFETKEENKLEIAPAFDISMTEKSGQHYEFTFDRVFDSQSRQDDIFTEISQLVQSAIDGYNVCIFAYGQTGSGKTYTMDGPGEITDFMSMEEDERLGMIPRSVQHIFQTAEKLQEKGWNYNMTTSFMEIYNEIIRDLLSEKSSSNMAKCEIKISAGRGNDSFVSNVKTVSVTRKEEVYCLLKKAKVNRAVAATNCNEHSSRSHYIFQMRIIGENVVTGEKCEGILNLVDLAGSERIKQSGSEGDRLKEAKSINKSLSNLGNVIMALSQRTEQHVPYRNSKLTHLLMNSLGGNSKTLMFVNVNPCKDSFSESVNSLRFATTVNQCNIGTAHKRVK